MHRYMKFAFLPIILLASMGSSSWNPELWLADLAQIRTSIDRDYPNRDWLVSEREVSLDQWYNRTADALRNSNSDADARRAFDALIARFNDGHVSLQWPEPSGGGDQSTEPQRITTPSQFCAARGYNAGQVTAGTASALLGYRPIRSDGPFKTGVVPVSGATLGVLRIGVFSPQGYPSLCERAVEAARIQVSQPCDAGCEDRILTDVYAMMTRELMAALDELRAANATTLLVDVTRNGGGTEWAEAAARIVSPVPLRSAPISVVRSERWVQNWRDLGARLRQLSRTASRADRALLQDYARRADVLANGLRPCPTSHCPRLASAGFATGLVDTMPAGTLTGRDWAAEVFSPAQYPYRDSVWSAPVVVLVDGETWSAAEQFAAALRDNDAVIILGARTGGAGCGHLYGSNPITLTNSGAMLELPNCARFRRDGSNEVGGIVPDVMTGARANDGAAFAARLTSSKLPEAMAMARATALAHLAVR